MIVCCYREWIQIGFLRILNGSISLRILVSISSLSHMKITISVTKSLHQDRGPYYSHLPIFSYAYTLLFYCGKKVNVVAVFLSELDHKPLFNDIYYETILV